MAVRTNSYYNDPSIGEAFSNLASMFKVPSGADLAGYANAKATREKATRLSTLFEMSQQPNVDTARFDRGNIATGNYAPNQSYWGVDRNNETSRMNNAADNARAIEVARIGARGGTDRAMLAPVSVGQTRFVPPTLAQLYGVPEHQVGAIESKPGEITATPDGRVFRGDPKPLSLDETKARELSQMRQEGLIGDPEMRAAIFGNTPLETVQTPDGPRNVFRPNAVGQAPVMSPDKAQLANYKAPGGATGTARFDPSANDWVDTATGQRLPAGSQTFSATLQGGKAETGLGPTTANTTDANKREAELLKTRDLLKTYQGLLAENPGVIGVVGSVRGITQDMVQTIREGAEAFSSNPQQFEAMLAQAEAAARQKGFDPNIARAQFLRHVLAYRLAKTQDPSGEVNVRELERNREALGEGVLTNQKSTLAKLAEFERMLTSEQSAISTLRAPGQQPAAPAAAPAVEEWTRGPDGKLMRAK